MDTVALGVFTKIIVGQKLKKDHKFSIRAVASCSRSLQPSPL